MWKNIFDVQEVPGMKFHHLLLQGVSLLSIDIKEEKSYGNTNTQPIREGC